MRQAIALLVFVMLLGGGCSKPPAPPAPATEPAPPPPGEPAAPVLTQPEPQPAPEPPVTSPTAYLDRIALPADWVMSGVAEAEVDEEGFDVRFTLPPETTREQVKAGLSIDAPAQPRLYFSPPHRSLDVLVRFPPGKAGEVITVRLGELGFRITRHPSPRIEVQLRRTGGDWEPLNHTIPVLPPQPLEFRFRLHGGIDPDEALLKIHGALTKARHYAQKEGADEILVTVPEPPPLIAFDFMNLKGEHGTMMEGGATVYIGEPPALVLLDPVTGKEQRIREVPPDLLRTSLSPDGNWMLLSGMVPGSSWRDRVWVLNLRRNELTLTPLRDEAVRGGPVVWLKERLVVPVSYEVQTWHLAAQTSEVRPSGAAWWETTSPDGRYIAGYEVDMGRESRQWLAPATLFLYDTQTGTEKSFPDLIQYRVRHSGGFMTIGTEWGKDLLVRDFQATGSEFENVAPRLVRIDPATGKAEPSGDRDLDQWQPWIPGPGGWAYANQGGWGEVKLRAPDGTETSHGSGLVAGWRGDGRLLLIRWNAEERRYRWME